jgi:hypothetical protein
MKPKAEHTEWVDEDEDEGGEVEIDTSGVPVDWRDDHWFNFYWIAEIIQEREGVSRGVAERTLRELCATGDVRSVRCDAIEPEAIEPEIIRPSEWVKDQVDLVDDGLEIFVSCGDVQYWLDKQALAVGRQSKKIMFEGSFQEWIAEQHKKAAAAASTEEEPGAEPTSALVPIRASRKLGMARTAVKHLWPEGPPEALTNPQLEKQVGDWITAYCKKNNQPKPDIGRDTILRAAGRRQQ